ncbi:hypothetical protein XENOCAPTIV_000849 [Xenoophorus captivus]|uniref:Uncharacterized protein n=1 Tax=Xenoophorus captivus TaxID=1517983 RepID=A0ABV0R642_9TELE
MDYFLNICYLTESEKKFIGRRIGVRETPEKLHGQEGSIVVCLTATEDALLLYNSLMKRMFRVLHNVLHFMKNPSLHNDLQRFKRSPQNRVSLLYLLVELF